MDNQIKTPEQKLAQRQKQRKARQQRLLRDLAVLLAIVLSIASLVQSCSTRKAIDDLAATIAAKKAAQAEAQLQAEAEEAEAEAAPLTGTPGDGAITLSFVGDITLCGPQGTEDATAFDAIYAQSGEACFFENVKSIFEGDDLTVGNLECVLAATGSRVEKSVTFRADPSYVGILRAGNIEALNIASDHTRDYGDESHVDTIAALDNADLIRFGNNFTHLMELDGILVGFTGVDETSHGVGSLEELEKDIADLKAQGAQVIVVSIHWGQENAQTPDDLQIELGHGAIDAGADIVVGHHPGNLQGIEYYKGRYICYSLGTFITGDTTTEDRDTAIFQVTFTVNKDAGAVADYKVIPCTLFSETGTPQPTPLTGEDGERVLTRIYEMSAALDGGITRE